MALGEDEGDRLIRIEFTFPRGRGDITQITVDPSKDFNIVATQWMSHDREIIIRRCEIELKEYAEDTWFIEGRSTYRYQDGEEILDSRLDVTELDFHPEITDDLFQLKFPPKTRFYSKLAGRSVSHAELQRLRSEELMLPTANPAESTQQALTDQQFRFCRVEYRSVRREALGFGWSTDYPDADVGLASAVGKLTPINVSQDADSEQPVTTVMALDDPRLSDHEVIFMSDAGTAGLNPAEAEGLRRYLLGGGLLHVDDFWGTRAWRNWEAELRKIFPPDEFPIRDIPLDHELFHCYYDIDAVYQIPSIQYWSRPGSHPTSERGAETAQPHVRGLFDQAGRLMVVMTFNTDLGDGWEGLDEDREYAKEFSVDKAIPLGINIVVYAFTH